MRARSIAYWITTALTAFVFLSGGVAEIVRPEPLVAGMVHLGYPVYFIVILGVWKVLGGIAVLLPRMAILKEWAYAGIFFDLTGAAASHASVGDPALKIATPLFILIVVAASWALRPMNRRCGAAASKL